MWNDTDTPLAYLISFRSYGTWLHGDKRGAIDSFHNCYGAPYLPPTDTWLQHNRKQLKTHPLILGASERGAIDKAVREACDIRGWYLHACNVRTNHVHAVVTADSRADHVLSALKANATRQLREDKLWQHPFSPWAYKGSKIMLWTERSVANAINYVLNGQGEDLLKI